MKSLYETILSSTGSGTTRYKNIIKNATCTNLQINLLEITFKEFLQFVDKENMVRFLKRCFSDAKSGLTDIGRCTFYFKDGNFGVEISVMPNGVFRNGGKWFREAFVPKEELKEQDENKIFGINNFITPGNYMKYFHKSSSFKTKWGERLRNIVEDYIKYLNDNYDKITEKK